MRAYPRIDALPSLAGVAAGILLALLLQPVAAAEKDPYAGADDTWISISGTVDSVRRDNFTLDYGEGAISVEMDDGDRDADAYKLLPGDKVTVSGFVDDDFFQRTTIEASSVYVENLGTTFFSSGIDEEDPARIDLMVTTPVVVSTTVLEGTVTAISDDEFTIDTGLRKMEVDTDAMPYDPLDDEGYQKIEVGDRVQVTGRIDDELFEGRELVAESVVTLSYGAS